MEQQNNLKETMLVKAICPSMNEWVTGYYINWNGKDGIVAASDGNSDKFIDGCTYTINPDTLCRFTGIYCAETKKPVFEGDNVTGNFILWGRSAYLHWHGCNLFVDTTNVSVSYRVDFSDLYSFNFTLAGGNIYDTKPNDKDF